MKTLLKICSILLALAICMGVLAACGGTEDVTTTASPEDGKQPNGGEAPDGGETPGGDDEPDPDPDENTPGKDGIPIREARRREDGVGVRVTGTVAAITYSNGRKPAGVMLVDDTGSIYVYDAALASAVRVGETIRVDGTKTHWILEKEQENAAKFGYLGCCQLENVTLRAQDTTVRDFPTESVRRGSLKELLETPVTEDITSELWCVNALVQKKPGNGFVNYYFYDLDGTTGSYTYTQCNGSDFGWLDEFDGKICTVYLTAINAKSSAADCYFRLLPVKVVDEGFVFDPKDAPKHVVDYYGLPQLETSYTGDPAIELTASVSSELLGFENVTLSYASSDERIISFANEEGKTVLHCNSFGTATVTVTATYGESTYSDTVEITVMSNQTYESITVKEAQDAAVDSTVTVKGIVGPCVVNKDGFYLFDGTGMIAVLVDNADIFTRIKIGDEIVLSGRRECYKDSTTTAAGQTCIVGATVLANYYGAHDYNTDFFVSDKSLADLYVLDAKVDYTTMGYIVTATVELTESAYYTSIKLTHDGAVFNLYCSGADQYAFLHAFAGQEVTLELAVCNWNNKNYYRGCVLAVITEDGKICNELHFR